ncbi:MAG: TlpA disulfide reductase family protein [Saprospiraceae bacterium]|nr:TlpA disulfide reductase family protein [Saprospiraceae bacterium]
MQLLCSLLISLLLGLPAPADDSRTLPEVYVKTLDGQRVNIQDYGNNDKITVMSFWATWCAPCKRELDALMEFYPDWQESYNAEILAITIDNARALAKVKPLVVQKGWPYEILSDPNQELQQALNFQAIPQTFVLNREGEIVYEHTGYKPGDEYDLDDLIKELAGS